MQKRNIGTSATALSMEINQLSTSMTAATAHRDVPIRASRSKLLTPTLPIEHRRSRNAWQTLINVRGVIPEMERKSASRTQPATISTPPAAGSWRPLCGTEQHIRRLTDDRPARHAAQLVVAGHFVLRTTPATASLPHPSCQASIPLMQRLRRAVQTATQRETCYAIA